MKVAIIGSGITGMSAGITLQKAGIDTVIFEKMSTPGGVISVYKKDILINNALEFVFGTAQNTFANDMWQSLGMFTETPENKKQFKTFWWKGHSVSIYKDFDKTVKELISLGQADEKHILRLGKAVKKFQKIELPLITKASSDTLRRLIKIFFNCFPVIPEVLYYGLLSCRKYSKKMKSPELREFFADVLTGSRSVLQYIVLWSFFSAGNFSAPDNNQKEMTETLYENYIRYGGKVIFNKELISVTVKDKRICSLNFQNDTVSDFDHVIFTNDIFAVNTVFNNSGKRLNTLENTIKNEHITSSVMLYFSIDKEKASKIIDNLSIPCAPIKVGSRLLNNFSVRIQEDTQTDKKALSVTLYQNEKDFAVWKELNDDSTKQYKDEKQRIARCITKTIEERYPELKGCLQLSDMTTPLTYFRYTGVNCGGWMPEGWNPLIYLRYARGKMPGIKNAQLAGQKVFPIGGTTLGAFSAVKASQRLIKLCNKTD